jgi:hypothetical protein
MAWRSRQDPELVAPDELEALLEVERRIESELDEARAEAVRRVAATDANSARARRALEEELASRVVSDRELLARRIEERREFERRGSTERLARLAAFEREVSEQLVALVLARIEGSAG